MPSTPVDAPSRNLVTGVTGFAGCYLAEALLARGESVVGLTRSARWPAHRAHLAGALDGTDPDLPVLLLAHQPTFVDRAAAAGVDLQLSGHTHGGQIWPFHHLVRLDQPALAGLSRHGARTLLYTSRGTGFWGPPFRVFAPSEITLLVLRSPRPPAAPQH